MIQCPAPSLVNSAPLPISTKERFKCLDYDNIKEQPVVEDERPDDASIKPTAITLVRPPR